MARKSMTFMTMTTIFKIVTQTGGGPADFKQVAKISFTLELNWFLMQKVDYDKFLQNIDEGVSMVPYGGIHMLLVTKLY